MKLTLFIFTILISTLVCAQDTVSVKGIEKAIAEANKGNYVSVGLFNDESSTFPEDFFKIPTSKLVGLVIDNCKYQSLPNKLSTYQELFYFRYSWFLFSECPYNVFPQFLTSISTMKSIRVEGTKMTTLPESIIQLKGLESLSIYSCNLKHFPSAVLALHNLKSLDLSCNDFTSIPEGINQLKNLISLQFEGGACGATPIDKVPTTIGDLIHLESISFGYSEVGIKQLPESFFDLKNLRSFECNGCGLESLPKTLGNFTELRSLSLSNLHKFDALPQEIFELKKLQNFRFYLYGEKPTEGLIEQQEKLDEWGKGLEHYSFQINIK